MKDPAFLFYSSDFLTGTMLMDNEQIGKYIRLMCLQHQKGHLSEKEMLKVCGVYDEAIFSKFSKDDEGLYYNERLEQEINKRKKYSESRRQNRNKVNNSDTCVYLIKNTTNGLIKIGSSNNPQRRLIELKNQYKNDELILVAYVENVEQKLESDLHSQYKHLNKINEWYELSNEDVIEIMKTNHMIAHMHNHMYKHMENVNENENIKKKKDNKSNKDLKTDLPEFVTMTNDEYNKLLATHSKEFVDKCLERLSNYKGSTGKKYKSDYRAILSWVVDDVKKKMYSNQFNKDKPTMAYTNPEQTEFNDLERFYSNM